MWTVLLALERKTTGGQMERMVAASKQEMKRKRRESHAMPVRKQAGSVIAAFLRGGLLAR